MYNGYIQVGKATRLLAKQMNMIWLLIDPTNHIQSFGEQASRFIRIERAQYMYISC